MALVLLLTAAMLAGCVGDDPPDASGTDGDTTTSGTQGSGSAGDGTEPGGGDSGSDGSGSSGSGDAGGDEPTGPPPEPDVQTIDGLIGAKVHLLGPITSVGGTDDSIELSYEDNVTGYILRLEWDATTPITDVMGILVHRVQNSGNVAFDESGTSPVHLVAPRNATDGGVYDLEVMPGDAVPRVGVYQPFTVTIAKFQDIPFNPAWMPDG